MHNYFSSSYNTSDNWVILSPFANAIRDKINKKGIPLSEWNISINYGLKTGLNDAFIISGEKKKELILKDPKSAELIRPILRGRDIKRYHYDFPDLWLLYIPWHFPLDNNQNIKSASQTAEKMFAEQYPAVYQHLLGYKEALSARNSSETGIRYEWYALQRWGSKYKDDFSKRKIVYRQIGLEMDACLVDNQFLINDKCYMVVGVHLEYLLVIFNSKLFTKIIFSQTNIGGGKGSNFLNNICVPLPSTATEQNFINLYEQLIKANANKEFDKSANIERAINIAVCKLYDLDDNEIDYILN